MTSTATRDGARLAREPVPAPTQFIPPPKLRRRPALIAAAVTAICLGALLAGWAWTATSSTQEVLVARNGIERGSVIEDADLARVRLSADPALKPVSASEFDQVVGQRAALDIAEGSMLSPSSITSSLTPAAGSSVVGIALTPAQAPGLDLRYGDHVRVVVTPAEGDDLPSGVPTFNDAEVVGVHVSDETGQSVVDLLVPHADATVLATRVAAGNIALVLDSRDR